MMRSTLLTLTKQTMGRVRRRTSTNKRSMRFVVRNLRHRGSGKLKNDSNCGKLCHFSKGLKLHGGVDVAQSYTGGVEHWGVDTIQPILRRGVLLDVARHEKTDTLPEDFAIEVDSLQATAREQAVEVRKGDVVLVRTGWGCYWDNPKQYINEVRSPGVNLEAAEWLSALGVFAGGSDTIAFELVPSKSMPVHVHLLVESGIHIIEVLNLEELSQNEQWRFVLVAVPMKIVGGTGSPIRPIALV